MHRLTKRGALLALLREGVEVAVECRRNHGPIAVSQRDAVPLLGDGDRHDAHAGIGEEHHRRLGVLVREHHVAQRDHVLHVDRRVVGVGCIRSSE